MIEFPFDKQELFDKYKKVDDLPKNDFEKVAIMEVLLTDFEDRTYIEDEFNEVIKRHFSDFAWIRRELINFGYVQRDPEVGSYVVVKRNLTLEDIRSNTILKQHASSFIKL